MKCKYCGEAIPSKLAYCPKCKRMLSDEQLTMRKEMNGYKNPYMQRLEKLNEDKLKYNLKENEEPINIKAIIYIIIILLLFILLAFIFIR